MKEQLYTIPLNDAIAANDECPFCFIERKAENDIMDFVLGSQSSYMESDIRDMTDRAGFCRAHFKKMFDYGNTLGNAWILKTHYRRMIGEMNKEFKSYHPVKISLKDKFSKGDASLNSIAQWVRKKECSCYICDQFKETYERYLDTFFYLWKQDPDFCAKVKNGKGFCLSHFGDLCDAAELKLSTREKEDFFEVLLPLMQRNMERLYEDVSWMVEKFDYENKDADWKNSKDAIQRGMQKLKGGYPADLPHKSNR